MTISAPVFTGFIVAAASELLIPLIILLILGLKKKIAAVPLSFGFACFLVSQVLLRIPILQVLGTQDWFKAFALQTVPYIIMLSVTAGLFEESARLASAGIFLKKHRDFRDALSFGFGHGFCEVILLTGMAQINNIIYATAINNGTLSTMLAKLPAETTQQITNSMLAVKPEGIYLGILERVFAVTYHIFASVLVFKGVREHKIRFYFYAICAHTIFNFGGVMLTRYVNLWAGEGLMLVLAVTALLLIFRMKKSFSETDRSAADPFILPTTAQPLFSK
jgi:uncharacterized membrane protein YhfC